jgi:hypothetical protein
MRKVSGILILITVAVIPLLIVSCSPEACFEETNAYLKASLYLNETKKLKAPDSLTLYGINIPSAKIYDRASKVQPALFPLNPSSGTCSFIIKINGVADTIQFVYSSYPHLISKECGYTFYHDLDTFYYSKNAIDYIYRGNNRITTLNEENLRIFY